jgi:SAM-dependent methyltransferase
VDETDHHVDLRTDIPHPARMYDYYLGGKDHFPADRAAAEAAIAAYPPLRELARANRAFLGRAVRYAHARGLDQFLDVGTGIPTAGSTGEVLSGLGSPASVVYVDNDPIVLSHSRALLTRRPGGRTTVVQADLREPKAILESPEVQQALDLSRPVALLLVAVLHFVPDQDGAQEAVRDLREALAPGSLLVLSHGSADFSTPSAADGGKEAYRNASSPLVLRPRSEIARFFGDFALADPGLVQLPLWRPDAAPAPGWQSLSAYAGVAEKPLRP